MGNVRSIPALLKAMADPKLTHAAGAAFVRITGARRIESDQPLPPPPELPEDEAEFWNDTKPPDPGRAGAWWEKEKGGFTPEGRWQAGRDVSKQPLGEVFPLLPLECRRDLYFCIRASDPQQTADLELEKRALRKRGGTTLAG
jgi:hypothetical protein